MESLIDGDVCVVAAQLWPVSATSQLHLLPNPRYSEAGDTSPGATVAIPHIIRSLGSKETHI